MIKHDKQDAKLETQTQTQSQTQTDELDCPECFPEPLKVNTGVNAGKASASV